MEWKISAIRTFVVVWLSHVTSLENIVRRTTHKHENHLRLLIARAKALSAIHRTLAMEKDAFKPSAVSGFQSGSRSFLNSKIDGT